MGCCLDFFEQLEGLVVSAREPEPDDPDRVVAVGERTTIGSVPGDEAVDLAGKQQGLFNAGRHMGIEAARLGVRRQRLFEETAVAARMHESGEQFRIVGPADCLAHEPFKSAPAVTGVRLEVGVVPCGRSTAAD